MKFEVVPNDIKEGKQPIVKPVEQKLTPKILRPLYDSRKDTRKIKNSNNALVKLQRKISYSNSVSYPWIEKSSAFQSLYDNASSDRHAKVISFVGNQQSGKSTLVRSIMRYKSWESSNSIDNLPDGPIANDTKGELPCSADVSAYPVDEYWLLDFEGLNARDIPSQVSYLFLISSPIIRLEK